MMQSVNIGELLQLGGLGAIAFFCVWFITMRVQRSLDDTQTTNNKNATVLDLINQKLDILLDRKKK